MKKWVALLMVTTLLLSCAACGSVEAGLDTVVDAVGEQLNKQITKGSIEGNIYSSEFSGLNFTKPDSWVFATDEEIAQTMSIGQEVLDDMTAYQEAVSKMATVYDMMVQDFETGCNISVVYENLTLSGSVGMTEEEYIEAVTTQLAAIEDMEYTFGETTTMVVLSGEVYRCFSTYVSVNGIQIQQNYYVRAMDNYMNSVIVTLVNGALSAQDVEAMFS